MHPDNCPLLHGEGFCFESEIALQMRPYLFRIVIACPCPLPPPPPLCEAGPRLSLPSARPLLRYLFAKWFDRFQTPALVAVLAGVARQCLLLLCLRRG